MRFLQFIEEQKEKHAVLTFGRMNPPTTGHEVLVNKVKDIAKQVGGSHHIVLSHSQDKAKNPLTAEQKLKHAKRYFPGANISVATKEEPNFLTQAAKLHKAGVTHLHMVAGSDRVDEYHKLLHKYNGTHKGALFNFSNIQVHSAGERDPDAEDTSGMSASKMRKHAASGNFNEFKKGVPKHVAEHHAKELYDHVRKGMGINESLDIEFQLLISEGVHDTGIFKAVFLGGGPGSGKDYVMSKTLEGHGLVEINSDKAFEYLMDKNNLDMKMPDSEEEARDEIRKNAKNMTHIRERLALFGRNGVIINGTADDPEKLKKTKERLEELGYETMMVMVDTADEVSRQRNIMRGQRGGRTVKEKIRKEKWDKAQSVRPIYAELFGNSYVEFDNSLDADKATPEEQEAKEKELLNIFKNVQKFTKKPPKSQQSKDWIAYELQKKDTAPIEKKGSSVAPHPDSKAAEQAKQLGLTYYGFGRYGKNGKVTHRSVHDKLVEVQDAEQKKPTEYIAAASSSGSGVARQASIPAVQKKRLEKIRTTAKKKLPESVDQQFEDFLSEAVTVSFTADTVDELKSLMTPKTQNAESYELSDSFAKDALRLGKRYSVSENRSDSATLTNADVDAILESEDHEYIKDSKGKVRVFMLRSAAAKEAHQRGGEVVPNKPHGYSVRIKTKKEYQKPSTVHEGVRQTLTLQGVKARLLSESIDKGIEPGVSMAGAGESIARDKGEKIRRGKISVTETIGSGGEMINSIGDQKEDELKKKGINLSVFRSKRFL